VNKVRAQRVHAKRRAHARYGLTLNRRDLRAIVDQIQRGRARLIERQSNRLTLWIVTLRGQRTRVVYDAHRHSVVTFLPPTDDSALCDQAESK
jgi:hypothetical protein